MRNEMQSLMEELNNMFYTNAGYKSFPVDVVFENNAYKVYAEIPGVSKEDIKVTFDEGTLVISAENKKTTDIGSDIKLLSKISSLLIFPIKKSKELEEISPIPAK